MNVLKSMGGFAMGLAGLAMILLLALFLFAGVTWVTVHVYPWFAKASAFVIVIDVLLLLPLSIFRGLRPATAIGFTISAWVYGITNWMFGLLITYKLWGTFAVVVGIFIMGVGVVPIAMLASLIHGEWSTLGSLVLGTVLWLLAIIAGGWLSQSAESKLSYGQK